MANRPKLLAKALPAEVAGERVIKSSQLGWLESLTEAPGYFAAVITYDMSSKEDPSAYSIHLMRAVSPDGRWLRIESVRDLFHNQAESAFNEYDELAFRPGRS